VDSDAAAVDDRDREAVFVHHLEVGLDGLFGHSRCLFDRLALSCDAWQFGHEDAEAAFKLRLQDDLVLAPDVHGVEASAPIALRRTECKPGSTAIAANPFASARFQALVPEIGADFGGGSRALQKAKLPTCSHFLRWS